MDEKKILDLLLNTFVKMCDYIETTDELGCVKCPCRGECVLQCENTEFKYFKPMIESVKNKL